MQAQRRSAGIASATPANAARHRSQEKVMTAKTNAKETKVEDNNTDVPSTGAQGGYYAITTWLPTFLRTERKLTVLGTGGYLAIIIIGSLIGGCTSAWLSDRIGRRANFILFAACSILTVIVYTQIPVDDGMMLFLGFPLGFFSQGVFFPAWGRS
jgi:hypothetical protein